VNTSIITLTLAALCALGATSSIGCALETNEPQESVGSTALVVAPAEAPIPAAPLQIGALEIRAVQIPAPAEKPSHVPREEGVLQARRLVGPDGEPIVGARLGEGVHEGPPPPQPWEPPPDSEEHLPSQEGSSSTK
jgi:hypothetical protein